MFEITETAAVDAPRGGTRLRGKTVSALGCGLALDDFGTGFGSFTYLRTLPLSYLKIDISFVRSLLDSKDDRRVVQSIISIAERFGLRTIAEGVEDAADARPAARTRRRLRPGLPPRPPSPTRALARPPRSGDHFLSAPGLPGTAGREVGPYCGRRRMCGACGSGGAWRPRARVDWEGGYSPATFSTSTRRLAVPAQTPSSCVLCAARTAFVRRKLARTAGSAPLTDRHALACRVLNGGPLWQQRLPDEIGAEVALDLENAVAVLNRALDPVDDHPPSSSWRL